ncbi:MAG TPA: efflux RND transporter periplasmic adaptor subunit [Bacteroidales bacterium]|nr:efflux RND transporter periplasmic adaptor subunit [Bacteroidales bacterium]
MITNKVNKVNLVVLSLIGAVIITSCSSKNTNSLEGKVKRETICVAPKVPGRIAKIFVTESQIVKKGDTLAELYVPEIEAKMQQANGASQAATWQYNMAKHGATKDQKDQVIAMYEAAKEQLNLAEKSLARIKALYNDSLVSAQAYDEALTKYAMARSQCEAAAAKKQEVVGGLRDEQVRMAQGQMNQAYGALREAQNAYNERFIVAPQDMTIETIALHEGELALAGYSIFTGYSPSATYFRLTVPESKICDFKIDSIYTFCLPFMDNKEVKAQLTAVNELAKYAFKSSAYPQYQMGEAVYELKFVPVSKSVNDKLFNNFTVVLKY